MTQVITRFAPSPTGKLHIGNVRTALINWLYAKKHGGKFILRMDDTDVARSKEEYKQQIERDLKWLGLEWDSSFNQLSRITRYEECKQKLIASGRLYACYETPEELEIKRKFQLSSGKPPIYDRAALKLTKEQIENYQTQGRKPHYRFLVKDADIIWQDMVKGEIKYAGGNLSDPVIIRADGTMTYMLCSTIDDIDYNITHVIRGEDHVSNTAIQIQMFEALYAVAPTFGHLSLVKAKEDKISKREGGYDIESMRYEKCLEAMAINSFLALIGTSNHVVIHKNLADLVAQFDINSYSKSPTTFMPQELDQLNHKLVITLEFDEIRNFLTEYKLDQIDKSFWLAVRPNLQKLSDLKEWWQICHSPEQVDDLDHELLQTSAKLLPAEITSSTWQEWTTRVSKATGKKGKELFLPLRLALTGKTSGPELRDLLPLLSRDEILARLQ
ncbi:MAG: glutamate--tRNA ligase [Rickettsiales bacterium]|nr:glutamate--tRNA ligase [Rickettsiales bacterium]MCA0254868.1 glutamate--tRNA ligase [Pseudomonadota bacterium]